MLIGGGCGPDFSREFPGATTNIQDRESAEKRQQILLEGKILGRICYVLFLPVAGRGLDAAAREIENQPNPDPANDQVNPRLIEENNSRI